MFWLNYVTCTFVSTACRCLYGPRALTPCCKRTCAMACPNWTKRLVFFTETNGHYFIPIPSPSAVLSSCLMFLHRNSLPVECKRNMMAHALKPDSVFQRNGRVHLYRRGVCSVEYWLSWSAGRWRTIVVELVRNVMTPGNARWEKWRGKTQMERVASTRQLVHPVLLPTTKTCDTLACSMLRREISSKIIQFQHHCFRITLN